MTVPTLPNLYQTIVVHILVRPFFTYVPADSMHEKTVGQQVSYWMNITVEDIQSQYIKATVNARS